MNPIVDILQFDCEIVNIYTPSPDLFSQVNTFIMDRQVISTPEALSTFLTLMGSLPYKQHVT